MDREPVDDPDAPSPSKTSAKVLGEILRALRLHKVPDHTLKRKEGGIKWPRKIVAQWELLEALLDVAKKEGVHFSVASDQGYRRIGKFEKGIDISADVLRLYEVVYSLPPNDLSRKFTSVAEFIAKCAVKNGKPGGATYPEEEHEGALERRFDAYAAQFDDAVAAGEARIKESRILVVHGPVGIGKTDVAGNWVKKAVEAKLADVCVIDCASTAVSKITDRLRQHFLENDTTAVDDIKIVETIAQKARSAGDGPRSFIIFENLVEELKFSGLSRPGGSSGSSIVLRRVRELLSVIVKSLCPVSIILVIRTVNPPNSHSTSLPNFGLEDVVSGMDMHTSYREIAIAPLTPIQGAELLAKSGVHLPFEDRQVIATSLRGLPILIKWVASLGLGRDTPLTLQLMKAARSSSETEFQTIQEFGRRIFQGLDRSVGEDTGHPYAFLRLLALMPGRIAIERLRTILQNLSIRRLEDADLDELCELELVVKAADNTVDINPAIRSVLRNDLERVISGIAVDPMTDADELLRIHCFCAVCCIQALPGDSSDFDDSIFNEIEGAIYHLLEARRLLKHRTSPVDRAAGGDERGFLERVPTGEFTPQEATEYCYNNIVFRILFDRRHYVTRVLGKFEAKARVLMMFLDGYSSRGDIQYLEPSDQIKLLTELGICWMHSGWLKLALDAVSRIEAIVQTTKVDAPEAPVVVGAKSGIPPGWNVASEGRSTVAQILMRQGRPMGVVRGRMMDDIKIAEMIADLVLGSNAIEFDGGKYGSFAHASRRVICRDAQILFAAGKGNEAIARFELAEQLDRAVSDRPYLSGEAARRHVEALVRRGSAADLKKAHDIVNFLLKPRLPGVERLIRERPPRESQPRARSRETNDIIPIMTTHMMLQRVSNDLAGARMSEDRILSHRFYKLGECTYLGRVEFLMERARLRLVLEEDISATIAALEVLASTLDKRHLYLNRVDCMALLAELQSPEQRARTCLEFRINLPKVGWLLRLDDFELLSEEGNRSAVREFRF